MICVMVLWIDGVVVVVGDDDGFLVAIIARPCVPVTWIIGFVVYHECVR